ncbi:hypothetical protein BVRB_9g205060 [Beta vulgaris subsp. vulgaris]|nr:hypothetical protein BVRB_9g205060 [Beta vulgaris subsp. vulgaris]
MAVISHRHTIGFRRLREDLADQTKLALDRKLQIDKLEKELATEKKKLVDDKTLWDQKIKDFEWKDFQAGKDSAADMGLLGAEVATEVTLGKLREALGKAHPSGDRSAIEAEYNSIIAAELEADTLLDIEGILMDEV